MAQCNEIGLMLGAFEDGELEPHEMQEVARHLAQCPACEADLSATAALGHQLRAVAIEPDLAGFAQAVQKRIASLTPPMHVRVRRYFESLGEQMTMAIALGSAGLATAALTAVLLTPYVDRFGTQGSQVASVTHGQPTTTTAGAVEVVERDVSPDDSQASISSLESHVPSVAVWSAPQGKTTVIWVPDQP